ncbi:hypothetical protein E4T44_15249 [Aureobasidium sp. EXF-8845]|nr:hypothetical protein E4T45_15095 [Aureobasidium sp. EXF-8846]KAI4736568.1 hypothetical protein E4T44_15249 [Aureobasidium sp. EXF-8845]
MATITRRPSRRVLTSNFGTMPFLEMVVPRPIRSSQESPPSVVSSTILAWPATLANMILPSSAHPSILEPATVPVPDLALAVSVKVQDA